MGRAGSRLTTGFCRCFLSSDGLAVEGYGAEFGRGVGEARRLDRGWRGTAGSSLKGIGHYIYKGDTALHFAAAAYRPRMVDQLVKAGANVRSRNRRGGEPLHAAAFGSPGSERWDPAAQAATIVSLIKAGADPNAANMDGATPLHRAVRTLLENGADRNRRNKSGSRAVDLARQTTGRSGSGSAEAKVQQVEILARLAAEDES